MMLMKLSQIKRTIIRKQNVKVALELLLSLFLEGIEFPKLEEEEADRCEGLVTTEEVGQALNSMKNGSAAGGDGLTVDFLNLFWPKLKIMVTNTFNEAFASEELTYT